MKALRVAFVLLAIFASLGFALPDLVISLNITPTTSNVTYLLRVTTTNVGASAAPNTTSAVWISGYQPNWYQQIAVPPLFPGQSHQSFLEIHCSSVNSSRQVGGRADHLLNVWESDEWNNEALQVTMQACPPGVLPNFPDLTMALNITPSASMNFTYDVGIRTSNLGNETAHNVTGLLWSNYGLGEMNFTIAEFGPLQVQEEYRSVHCSPAGGTITGRVDSQWHVNEFNEDNNDANLILVPSCTTQPDLVISLNITGGEINATHRRVGIAIQNTGNWTADNSTARVGGSLIRVPQLQAGGGYYIYVYLPCINTDGVASGTVDYWNQIPESNESNNAASIILPACSIMPDLIVALNLTPIDETNVTYSVGVATINIGNGSANNPTITRLYLEPPNAVSIQVPPLAPGQIHEVIGNWTIHCGINSTVVYARANYNWSGVYEWNDTNNWGNGTGPPCPPLADLATEIGFTGNYTENGTLYHRREFSITNIGQLPAPASITRVYNLANNTDMMIETPPLSPGQTYAGIVDIPCREIWWDSLYVMADNNDSVVEIDEHSNNFRERGLAPCPQPPQYNDLVIASIEAPRIVRVGRSFNASVTTLNIGTVYAYGSVTHVTFGGISIGDAQVPDMLPPNVPFVASFEARCDASGTFALEAIADFTNANAELNETNNRRNVTIRCINVIVNRTAPTPVITRVPIKDEEVELPQPIQIEVIVEDSQAQDVGVGRKNESEIQLPEAPQEKKGEGRAAEVVPDKAR